MESEKPEVDDQRVPIGGPESQSTDEELESMARNALECPCVAELRDGPCGSQFSEAFICYFKSTAAEKGSDCVPSFLAMQACIEAKPELFSKSKIDDDDGDEGSSDSDSDLHPRPRRSSRRSKTPPPPGPKKKAPDSG